MKKILVVEDDNSMRDVLSDHLSRQYEIARARDGEEGYKFIMDFRPDLVILDLLLPKLTGLDMLEQVRNNPDPSIANTKVIVFSNFSDPQFLARAQELKVNEYLVKASTGLEELVKKIEKIINEP